MVNPGPDLDIAMELIKRIGRLLSLKPTSDLMVPTLQAGYSSAYHIASVTEDHFVDDLRRVVPDAIFASWNGTNFVALKELHTRAVASRYKSTINIMQANDYVRGYGLRVIDGDTTALSRTTALDNFMASSGMASQRLLGELDNFICPDCKSVSCSAAYLVEILKFLPENARSRLLSRRPDIANVELTCENTNTEMLYIDIGNELMESFMSHMAEGRSNIDVHNTTKDDESAELKAESEFVLRSVYSQAFKAGAALQNSYFPLTLPYSVDLDKTRLLLQSFKISRYDLLITFSSPDKVSTSAIFEQAQKLRLLQSVVIENAANAEYPGLSSADFLIITKQPYWPQEYISIIHDDVSSPDVYQALVGVPTIPQTWGYTSSDDMLSTDDQKPDNRKGLFYLQQSFLPRSGLTFAQYISLTKTHHIGPLLKPFEGTIQSDDVHYLLDLDESSWGRINSFLRLILRTNMSIEALDTSITDLRGFDAVREVITPNFLSDLVVVIKLQTMTSLDVLAILSFWNPMWITGERSLYTRTFL